MTAAAHNPNYGWRDNLDRNAATAANLTKEWTDNDVISFVAFMTRFSPQAVQAFHNQRPSEVRRRADAYTAGVRAVAVRSAEQRRCPKCGRSAALKAVGDGWKCRWTDCGHTDLQGGGRRA